MALRILIADDHPDHVVMLTEFLVARGHRVETVTDGTAAVDAARRRRDGRTPYHLVILDLMMPGFDGLQVARELRLWQDPADIAFMTAYGATAVSLPGEARALKALDVIDKPLDLARVDRLVATVEERVRSLPGAGPADEPPVGPGTARNVRTDRIPGEDSRTGSYIPGAPAPATEALERRGAPPLSPVAPVASAAPITRGTDRFRRPSGLYPMGGTTRYGRPGTPTPQPPTSTTRIRRGVSGTDRVGKVTPAVAPTPSSGAGAPATVDGAPGRTVVCLHCRREFVALNRSVSYTTICIHCGQLNRIDPA
jgi:CheY-like chemotaxis protein